MNVNETRMSIVYNCLVKYPESRSDDMILMSCILTEFGIDPRNVNVAMLAFLRKDILSQIGFYNIATISRTRRKVMEKYPYLKPAKAYSERKKDVREYEKECMVNVPCFMERVAKTNLNFSQNSIEDYMRIVGNKNR